jgi:hypothetical protein
VKEEGKENDLIERILNDDSLKLDKSKLKEVLDPKLYRFCTNSDGRIHCK